MTARPFPPPTGWRPTTPQVPADQVQFFNAPCPTCGGLAEWVASRVDSRSRSEVWCPACGAASPVPSVVSPDLRERWSGDGGSDGPESGRELSLAAWTLEVAYREGAA